MARRTSYPLYKDPSDGFYKPRRNLMGKLMRKVSGGATGAVTKLAVWGAIGYGAWWAVTKAIGMALGLVFWPVGLVLGGVGTILGLVLPPAFLAGAGLLGWKFRKEIKSLISGR